MSIRKPARLPVHPPPERPYARVVHVEADEPDWSDVEDRRGSRTFFVLWREDRAVGHVWVPEDGDPMQAVRTAVEIAPHPDVAKAAAPATTVSVVICTRDRPEALERCLASFSRQAREPDEVIVVDNASRGPETRQVALAAGVTYIREDRPGLDIARNSGLLAANSDIIAYTDDDTELHPRWLERIVAAFDDPAILAVTGLVLPAVLDTEPQWVFERDWGFGKGYVTRDFGPSFYRATRARGCPAWDIGAGANMAFRRGVVDSAGLFDERLDVGAAGCSGDSEYWYRILAKGGTCRYEPSAIVLHHHREDAAGLKRQIFYYMRGHVSALLIQYERTRGLGNLHRLIVGLPQYFATQATRRLVLRRAAPANLRPQLKGSLSGLLYYFKTRGGDRVAT